MQIKRVLETLQLSPLEMRRFQRVYLIDRENVNDWLVLQYWPDSLSDSINVTYESKSIPGSTAAMQQWISTGPRTLNFKAKLACEIDLKAMPVSPQFLSLRRGDKSVLDINAVVLWLRRFLYPKYDKRRNEAGSSPPHNLWVCFPNTVLNYRPAGEAGIPTQLQVPPMSAFLCRMTKCDVEYKAWFPSGQPRAAEVDLSFVEIVENWSVNAWTGRKDLDRLLRRLGRR